MWTKNRLSGKVKPNCLKSQVFGKFGNILNDGVVEVAETPSLGTMLDI
jgi:hypothetical protein